MSMHAPYIYLSSLLYFILYFQAHNKIHVCTVDVSSHIYDTIHKNNVKI